MEKQSTLSFFQVVSVNFSTRNEKEARNISNSITQTLENNIVKLNQEQNQENWFKIVPVGPIIRVNSVNWIVTILAALTFGAFLALMIVLIKYYFKK